MNRDMIWSRPRVISFRIQQITYLILNLNLNLNPGQGMCVRGQQESDTTEKREGQGSRILGSTGVKKKKRDRSTEFSTTGSWILFSYLAGWILAAPFV